MPNYYNKRQKKIKMPPAPENLKVKDAHQLIYMWPNWKGTF